MEEKIYDFPYLLLKECVPVIEQAIERQSKRGRLIPDRKTVRILHDFQRGKITLAQAEQILALVWAESEQALAHPKAGNIGSTSLLVGARTELATAVQLLSECEKENPDQDADAVLCIALSKRIDQRKGL